MTCWISGALDELCEVEYGTRVTHKRDGGTKYPVYGGGGATFNLDDFNRQDQMIVSRFAMSEVCVRFVPGKFFLNDSGLTVRTRDESKMSQDFLDQQLLARSNEIYMTARGTAQKNMDMTMFRSMELAYPDSLKEQKRIVELLDTATARVTELTACYEQARTHANNLFASALRDALEGNSDWPTKRLDEISDVRDGTHDSPKSSDSGFPLVTSKNIRNGQISLEGSYLISALDYEQISRRSKVDEFDLLISMIGTVGEVCMVTSEPNFAIKNVGLIKTSNEPLSRFLRYYLVSPAGKNQIRESESGTTQRFIGLGKLRGLEIPVPPLDEQKQIVARLDLMRAKTSEMVAAYDAKLTAVKNLRQSILAAAFEGDL